MDIVEIRYDRTKNLGDYNSEKLGATATLSPTDNPNKCILELKAFVNGVGSIDVSENSPHVEIKDEEPIKIELAPAPVAVLIGENGQKLHGNSKAAKEVNGTKKKEKVEIKVAEVKKVEAPVEEKKVEAPAPKKQVAATKYDRNNDLHKKILSEMLDVKFKNWKANPSKAKQVSIDLDGSDFLDAEGRPMKEFIEILEGKMK